MRNLQRKLAERCLELLALPEGAQGAAILDVGSGSGLSGEAISAAGHWHLGFDISGAMLRQARASHLRNVDKVARDHRIDMSSGEEEGGESSEEDEVPVTSAYSGLPGDLIEQDMGQGLPLRPGAFDGAISVSAVQWLCNVDKASHVPQQRLATFFRTLYGALRRGARAVLQLYPESPAQLDMIVAAATRAGFSGGVLVDYPNSTRAKKFYLVLMVGQQAMPAAKTGDEGRRADRGATAPLVEARARLGRAARKAQARKGVKTAAWVQRKKDRARAQGKIVKSDSKYTGRRRRAGF
jgi:18S rRNA (guanine1575-N7)-methyltransferase